MIQRETADASPSRSQSAAAPASHTPTPWFVSGVRFRMNGGEWQSVNRYDESLKRDENIACVGYDPRNGSGLADAHFIVKAVNAHDALVDAVAMACEYLEAENGFRPAERLREKFLAILKGIGVEP